MNSYKLEILSNSLTIINSDFATREEQNKALSDALDTFKIPSLEEQISKESDEEIIKQILFYEESLDTLTQKLSSLKGRYDHRGNWVSLESQQSRMMERIQEDQYVLSIYKAEFNRR